MDTTKRLNLNLSGGGDRVLWPEVVRVPTPQADGVWHPLPHERLVMGVIGQLERTGLRVAQQAHGLARGGARYFGLFEMVGTDGSSESDDYGLVVGVRNSHDKSFPAGIACGSGVFVCSNLAFSSDIVIARKHTTHIERDLPRLIEEAIGRLGDMRAHQRNRIAAYKGRTITDAEAHNAIIGMLDADVITPTIIPDMLRHYREPKHEEFRAGGMTAWRLFNAATETLKERGSLFDRPRLTQRLHGIVDAVCGVV